MTMNSNDGEWERILQSKLSERRKQGLLRERRTVTPVSATEIEINGVRLVNFGSNDYLSLTWNPELVGAAKTAMEQWPTGAGASALVTGRGPWMSDLEATIADFEKTDDAIVFGSGFAANAGTISALANQDDVIFSDALNHASLIDGCRLSRCKIHIYRHSDMTDLEQLIRRHRSEGRQAFIVSDSVFSMEGDIAPLKEIATIARRYHAQIILDEAHATGVLGSEGRGLTEHFDVDELVDVRIGTLSKAVGSIGGFVAGREVLINFLVNQARSYIYSTAMPPISAAVACAALKLIPHLKPERGRLLVLSNYCRRRMIETDWKTPQGVTPIIPIVVGDAETVVRLSQALFEQGIFAPCIRPPTVPKNQSMLRISLTVSHTVEQVDQLVSQLQRIRTSLGNE